MATVDIRIDFKTEGFQTILNSGAMRALVESTAQSVAANVGRARVAMFTATSFQYGPRPAAYVITAAKTQEQADRFRRVMEGQVH